MAFQGRINTNDMFGGIQLVEIAFVLHILLKQMCVLATGCS